MCAKKYVYSITDLIVFLSKSMRDKINVFLIQMNEALIIDYFTALRSLKNAALILKKSFEFKTIDNNPITEEKLIGTYILYEAVLARYKINDE